MTEWTDDKVAELRRLHALGMSAGQIGLELGLTRNTVGGKLHRLGLRPGAPRNAGRKPGSKNSPQQRAERQQKSSNLRVRFEQIEVVDLPPEQSAHAVPLMKLNANTCRWPMGDPRDLDKMRFCGTAPKNDKPYCDRHCRMAYRRYQNVEAA